MVATEERWGDIMPRKDVYHQTVVEALTADDWISLRIR